MGYYKAEVNPCGYRPLNTCYGNIDEKMEISWEYYRDKVIISSPCPITMNESDIKEIYDITPEITEIKLSGDKRLFIGIPESIYFGTVEEKVLSYLFKHLNQKV